MNCKSVEEILSAVQAIADRMEIEIVEIEVKAHKDPSVTFYVDKVGGIDLDACAAFHEAIDPVLDELDPTFGLPYTLNVSSPGLDRPFKTARDFQRAMGERVEIKLYAPVKGKKFFEGELKEYDGNSVTVQTEKETVKFNMTQVAKINKAIDFE